MTTDDGSNAVGLNALEGYFDNLSAAATKDKTVIEKLVTSNAKLATTNEELVDVVKTLTKENKYIQREINLLNQWDGSKATQGKRDPTMCPHCKKEGYHVTRPIGTSE